ncbi:MAG: 4Fe-4S dicluster domain-containing protein [Dethiobacteria bacterium]|jgi:Fe-S-cluster-containing dehydrogenase component
MEKAIYIDISICSGCGACVVACMDQNDIFPEKGQPAFRRIYMLEEGKFPDTSIMYFSTACLHCEDSPCIMGCPTGAITKDRRTSAVLVNNDLCIGCHSCALACPFGVPRYDLDEKMQKCNLCSERVKAGLEPACVRVCPTGALQFKSLNETLENKEFVFISNIIGKINKSQQL